jgi:hypothetical protein
MRSVTDPQKGSWLPPSRDPPSRIGPAILLGLVGVVLGAIIGFFGGGVVASMTCAMSDSFECMAVLLVVFTTPAGALIGAIVGIVAGLRRPRAGRGPGEASGRVLSGPPVWRESPASSWLGVIGGLATCYGVLSGWRMVVLLSIEDFGMDSVLTPGPEALGALGGLAVLIGGTLRILRPAAPSPGALLGVGAVGAAIGLAWGRLDMLGVPDRLPWGLLIGFWISLVGVALSIAAWAFDRRYRRVGAST